MSGMITFLLFVIMLAAIISIHEFGHFVACKIFNVYVSEFSIGMGKQLYSHKGKETTFSIRMLPLGGYCAIAGDNDSDFEAKQDYDETSIPEERTLKGVAKWKKIIILLSGVTMNLLLALLIVSGVYLYEGQASVSPKPIIQEVVESSPAERGGLVKEDLIVKAEYENGYSISPSTFSELSDFLLLYESGEIKLTVKRGNETLNLEVTPEYSEESDSYMIGIYSKQFDVVDINIGNCFIYATEYLRTMFKLMLTTILGLFRGVGLNNISGPVGIYNATSQVVAQGFEPYLLLIAMLSLNVAMFNLIPLPALDGGRVILTLVEAIIGRPISKKLEEVIMTASMIIFIGLLVFATWQDILKLFVK